MNVFIHVDGLHSNYVFFCIALLALLSVVLNTCMLWMYEWCGRAFPQQLWQQYNSGHNIRTRVTPVQLLWPLLYHCWEWNRTLNLHLLELVQCLFIWYKHSSHNVEYKCSTGVFHWFASPRIHFCFTGNVSDEREVFQDIVEGCISWGWLSGMFMLATSHWSFSVFDYQAVNDV